MRRPLSELAADDAQQRLQKAHLALSL